MDRIRSEIRWTTNVVEIIKKTQERRLQWFEHMRRREELHAGKKVMEMKMWGRRPIDRPKSRWMDCVREGLRGKLLSEDDMHEESCLKHRAQINVGEDVK